MLWAKQNASMAMREVAVDLLLKKDANSINQRILIQEKLSDTKTRQDYLRKRAITIWTSKGYHVPPAKAPAKTTAAADDEKKADDDDEKSSDDSSSSASEAERAERAKEQRLEEQRAAAYNALTPEARAKNDLNCQRALVTQLLTHVEVARMLPFVPPRVTDLPCAFLHFPTDASRPSALLIDSSLLRSFYDPRTSDAIIMSRQPIPSQRMRGSGGQPDYFWRILDALAFGTRFHERLCDSWKQTSYTAPQIKLLAKALSASFFIDCGAKVRARFFAALFCGEAAQPPLSWFEWDKQPRVLSAKNDARDRSFATAAKTAAKVCVEAEALLDSLTEAPKISVAAPAAAPKKRAAPAAKKLAEALKDEAEGVALREPRVGAALFYEDDNIGVESVFNHLATPELDTLRIEFDSAMTVRTADEAVAAFGSIGGELNTTSTKPDDDEDDDNEVDEDVETASEGDNIACVLKKSDERLLEKIAAEANVSLAAVQLEYLKAIDAKIAAGIKADMPTWPQLTQRECVVVADAAEKVRAEHKQRSVTTKRSEISLVANRVTKPAQNSLTRVGPALSYPASWVTRQITSVAVQASNNWTYGDVMKLRDQIKQTNSVSTADALAVLWASANIERQMKTTIAHMGKTGALFKPCMPLHNKVAVVRQATAVGGGFATWLARCLMMQTATDALVQMCFTEVTKTTQERLMAQIPNLPAGWSPLTQWSAQPQETATIPVSDVPHVQEIARALAARLN
jgi:hypothetical protein